jgi:hypothetical protein
VKVDLDARLREILKPKDEELLQLKQCLEAALEDYRRESTEGGQPDLGSPAFFGLLTSHVLRREDISEGTKQRACLEVFHSIPLPEREDEAFLIEDTVPRGLQEAAHFLMKKGEFVEYHLLHLIYALYLDPGLSSTAPSGILEHNLRTILEEDLQESLRLLYAYLLLSSPVLEPETARRLLSILLEAPEIAADAKRSICLAAMDRTFAVAWFARLATAEGLFPREEGAQDAVLREVRVRPLHQALSEMAAEWIVTHGSGKP